MIWPFVSLAFHEATVSRWDALLTAERARYDDLLAKYDKAVHRLVDLADLAIRPAPVTVGASVPAFEDFPPIVAGALAVANSGFTKDLQRGNYVWAKAELDRGQAPEVVAQMLRKGLPVDIDAMTAD